MKKVTSEERIQEFIDSIKKDGLDYKRIEMFVEPVNKIITFIISIYNQDQINEYLWDSETLEEYEEIEFWVQEMCGAEKLAKEIGMVDTHYSS
jgi:hypothetical protein